MAVCALTRKRLAAPGGGGHTLPRAAVSLPHLQPRLGAPAAPFKEACAARSLAGARTCHPGHPPTPCWRG